MKNSLGTYKAIYNIAQLNFPDSSPPRFLDDFWIDPIF